MTLLVTGGCGFIGSNFILDWLVQSVEPIINLDLLTYAGNPQNLACLNDTPHYTFIQGNINDIELVLTLLKRYQPRAIVNFAAESHVDRSIHGPQTFIQTNIVGTFWLLEAARTYWQNHPPSPEHRNQEAGAHQPPFRFLHVSTDEVYGDLEPNAHAFTETHRYQPNSPYSASKASADHLVRAYHRTYGLPTLITHCSNNYGPYQFPEKLIPLIIHNALLGKPLPLYGDGQQIRDWLHVSDHSHAIRRILDAGQPGENYNIGGLNEKTNLEIVHHLCELLETLVPENSYSRAAGHAGGFKSLIKYTQDRPGHDRRYAIDATKITRELGWRPIETLETGLRKTVLWYLHHQAWVTHVVSGEYRQWVVKHYGS